MSVLLSCSGKYEYSELESLIGKMSAGDFSSFFPLDNYKLKKLLKTDEASLFCLGVHLMDSGFYEEAKCVFSFGVQNCKEPFNIVCERQIYNLYTTEEKLRFMRQRLKLLEKEKKDSKQNSLSAPQVLNHLSKESHNEYNEKEIFFVKEEIQRLLFVSGQFDELENNLPELYASSAITSESLNIYLNLQHSRHYFEDFYKTMEMRILVFEKKFENAWKKAETLLSSDSSYIFSRYILSDIGRAALYGSRNYAETAAFFEKAFFKCSEKQKLQEVLKNKADVNPAVQYPDSEQDFQTAKYIFAFYAGRLYGKADIKLCKKALHFFELAQKNAVSEKDFDNALWYKLKTEKKNGFDSFLQELMKSASLWYDSYWFEDLISEAVVRLVSEKDFKRLKLLAESVKDTELAEIQSAISYILARSNILSPEETVMAYKTAYEKDHNFLYYRVLSAVKLNVPLVQPLYRKKIERKPNPIYTAGQAFSILNAYARYRLYKHIYPQTVKIYPNIQVHEAAIFSEELAKNGLYADSIKIMTFAVNSQDSVFNENHLKMIYPRPWLANVEKWSREYDVPEYLLYALIRSESYFKPAVVSHAGAVGLSQLMPSTAADIARKLKIKTYDLTEPCLNIRFGAYYLSEMIRRYDGRIMPALFSYNAGISTVRRWEKNSAELPEDLFLETLPYSETRGYGKNVLAAAVVYGSLYYGKTHAEIIKEIFPALYNP